jgi:hypothetical protein
MAGLVPAIHVLFGHWKQGVDARDNPRIKSGDGQDADSECSTAGVVLT